MNDTNYALEFLDIAASACERYATNPIPAETAAELAPHEAFMLPMLDSLMAVAASMVRVGLAEDWFTFNLMLRPAAEYHVNLTLLRMQQDKHLLYLYQRIERGKMELAERLMYSDAEVYEEMRAQINPKGYLKEARKAYKQYKKYDRHPFDLFADAGLEDVYEVAYSFSPITAPLHLAKFVSIMEEGEHDHHHGHGHDNHSHAHDMETRTCVPHYPEEYARTLAFLVADAFKQLAGVAPFIRYAAGFVQNFSAFDDLNKEWKKVRHLWQKDA